MNWYTLVAMMPFGLVSSFARVCKTPFWQLFWVVLGMGYILLQIVCLGLVIRDGVKLRKEVKAYRRSHELL